DTQVAIRNVRTLRALAPDRARWASAGDQLFVDFDLSAEHVPPGTRLAIGSATLVITDKPQTGCAKFSARLGAAALRCANPTDELGIVFIDHYAGAGENVPPRRATPVRRRPRDVRARRVAARARSGDHAWRARSSPRVLRQGPGRVHRRRRGRVGSGRAVSLR